MNWTLEVVIVPVSDVERAKEFYAERLGFTVDFDMEPGEGQRLVQLTPPGSGCSLVERGVDVSEIDVYGTGAWDGKADLDNVGFVRFSDPDGNSWAVQQISSRP